MKKMLLVFLSMVIICLVEKTIKAEVYGSISGKVYIEQTLEGLEGVRIQLLGGENLESVNWENMSGLRVGGKLDKLEESKTDKNGNYSFKLLPPGKYLLVLLGEAMKYNYESFRIINLKMGENIIKYDYKLTKYGSISGKIYNIDGINPLEATIRAYDGEKIYIAKGNISGEFLVKRLPKK